MGAGSGAASGAAAGSIAGPVGTVVGAGIGAAAGIFGSKKQAEAAKQAADTQAKANQAALDRQKVEDDRADAQLKIVNDAAEKAQAATEANNAALLQASEAKRIHDSNLSDQEFAASQSNSAAQLGLSRDQFNAQQAQYAAEQARRAPYRAAGQTALSHLGDLLGLSFAGGAAPAGAAAPSASGTPVASTASMPSTGAAAPMSTGGSPTPDADAAARAQAAGGSAPTENMAAIPGFDLGKLNDPTHVNAKYTNGAREFAYALNALQPSSDAAGVSKIVDYLNTVRGVPAKQVGDDKIDMGDGNGPIDVLIDSGKGGYAFQNNPQPGSNTTMAALLPGSAARPVTAPVATAAPVDTAAGPSGATPYTQVIPMRTLLRRQRVA